MYEDGAVVTRDVEPNTVVGGVPAENAVAQQLRANGHPLFFLRIESPSS